MSDNLEFRLGVAIGAAVSKAWSDGTDDRLQIPTLDSWKETTRLPWVAFWARELIRWGTHDPFIAFAMSQGISNTRAAALAKKDHFNSWLEANDQMDEQDPEVGIDPQTFMEWNRSIQDTDKEKRERFRHPAIVDQNLKSSVYQIVPILIDGKIHWIDPAGYTLAQSSGEPAKLPETNTRSDYVLRTKAKGGPEVSAVYRTR